MRIVEAIHQMNGARAGRAKAHTEAAGVFGDARGHKGGGLLMTHANITDAVLTLAQRLDDRIDECLSFGYGCGLPSQKGLLTGGSPPRRRECSPKKSSTPCSICKATFVTRGNPACDSGFPLAEILAQE